MNETPLWCKACGASTKVVNKTTHERNCRFGPVAWTTANPHKPPVALAKPDVANSSMANGDVANNDVANTKHMANDPGRNRASVTYRYRNPDKRRLYMRDLMRRRRASGNAA